MSKRANTVLVLDLDDTLYLERDYVASGRAHVLDLIERTFGRNLTIEANTFLAAEPAGDLWHHLAQQLGQPETTRSALKDQLLWAYRLHAPKIALSTEVRNWLATARNTYAALAILTDGRAITQRLKLVSLGLADLPAFISDEWGAPKPDPRRFEAIMQRWPNCHYVYVGDNPAKDFIAPNALDWLTLGLQLAPNTGVHPQDLALAPPKGPMSWITVLPDIDAAIRSHEA